MRTFRMIRVMVTFLGCLGNPLFGIAQKTCTSSPTTLSANINFASVTWTASGGATVTECNNMANGSITFNGNVIVDLANNVVLTISNNVTINGNFPITGGPGSTLKVNGGGASTTLHITGDLGDATNNGVDYVVTGVNDKMKIDGTLYGKNNNALSGNGSISGGAINVKNGTTCGSPCPASGGFPTCIAGDSFCTAYGLPITLLYFTSVLNKDNINLNWATAAELNFDYFNLEKSMNGIDFNSIANVKGHGTTNEKHEYGFEDNLPLIGKNYYRLTSIDFDNYQETFKVIVQEYSGEKNFQISPNPSNGRTINLNFNFDIKEGQVAIYDNIGSIIDSFHVNESGEVSFANTLKNGIYFAKYSSPLFTKAIRFLVNQ